MPFTIEMGIIAALAAFTITVAISPLILPFLIRLKFGQNIRSDGPQSHLKKAGTPTMGGVMFLISTTFVSLLFLRDNPAGLAILFAMVAFGFIGFLDDYTKVVRRRSLGLRAYQKIIGQFAVTTMFIAFVLHTNGSDVFSNTIIPFFGEFNIGFWWIPIVYIVMIGGTNSVNLTDGLDGLATGVTALVATFLMIICYQFASGGVGISGAVLGSLMGFLLFNSHPAKVFMGDTGSLALGGYVTATAIMLQIPFFLIIVGFVYVIEALSVIIQVVYFKMTKQRFFKMAPIHHSFEISGWSETKVVSFFYVLTAIGCLIGYLAI
ncbi:MAG: phospho-N-acetylmuramoyl-pentapeptide-transferase [Defluviitaleaceae bacterium]|nr:phospho-N-acetylmuramoyl-pentapeptide-transferase [Defluviitaleaceae bacterium]